MDTNVIQWYVNKWPGILKFSRSHSSGYRLAICLYRLGRGDNYYTIAEMTGVGLSTVATITEDVCEAIINNLRSDSVVGYFPKNRQAFREKNA